MKNWWPAAVIPISEPDSHLAKDVSLEAALREGGGYSLTGIRGERFLHVEGIHS
jgi:hypothetical protein